MGKLIPSSRHGSGGGWAKPERSRKPFRPRSLMPLVGTLGRGWSHTGHGVYCPRPSRSRPLARNATARDAANGFDTRFREPAGNQLPACLQDVPTGTEALRDINLEVPEG